MSLGNHIKKKKELKTKMVTITLPVNDWQILASSLQLLAECVGKLGIPTENVGVVYTNCVVLANQINKELNK